jgi:hypothetical protein
MRQLTLKLGIAVLTFSVGLVAYAAKVFVSAPADELTIPVAQFQEEEWHKLYEAAGMTGDPVTLRLVREKLMCTDIDGISNARMVALADSMRCERFDRTTYQYNRFVGPYGPFDDKIMNSHRLWCLRHLRFMKTLTPAPKARMYVSSHL